MRKYNSKYKYNKKRKIKKIKMRFNKICKRRINQWKIEAKFIVKILRMKKNLIKIYNLFLNNFSSLIYYLLFIDLFDT